jgi:hypothetical protein
MGIKWLQLKDIPGYIQKQTSLEFSPEIIYHWVTKGRKSESGRIVLLKATKRLGTWLTTEEWIDEFIKECSND